MVKNESLSMVILNNRYCSFTYIYIYITNEIKIQGKVPPHNVNSLSFNFYFIDLDHDLNVVSISK